MDLSQLFSQLGLNQTASSGTGTTGGTQPDYAGYANAISDLLNLLNSNSGQQQQQGGGTNWLQTLMGGGLALAGSAQKEPGEVTEARQFNRNLFTSPNAIPDILTGQINALSPYYQPLFNQQTKALLDEVQQRSVAGLPAGLNPVMGGPELKAIQDATVNQLYPTQQAFLASQAQNNLRTMTGGADSILKNDKGDPLSDALAQLGVLMAYSGMNGGGGGGGGLFGGGAGGAGGTSGGVNAGQLAQIGGALGSLFGGGASAGGAGGLGSLGAVAAPAAGVAAAAAAAYALYQVGKNNPDLADKWYGKISPLVWAGADKAQKELKAEYRQADLSSQADQVQEIGTFFEQRLQGMGIDTSALQSRIKYLVSTSESPANEQDMIVREGGSQLLAAIQARDPSIANLNQVPGLRKEFIDWMVANTFTSGNSSYGGGAPLDAIDIWANTAGL